MAMCMTPDDPISRRRFALLMLLMIVSAFYYSTQMFYVEAYEESNIVVDTA
jgi:hypothetical protein